MTQLTGTFKGKTRKPVNTQALAKNLCEKLTEAELAQVHEIVDLNELAQSSMDQYTKKLTKAELQQVMGLQTNKEYTSELFKVTFEMAAAGEILVSDAGRMFITVKNIQKMDQKTPQILSKELTDKLDNIAAGTLKAATDYSAQKQALGIKRML